MYEVGDAEKETSVEISRRHCEGGFDSVVGIFLFPYASSREQLRAMCKTAFGALRPGKKSSTSTISAIKFDNSQYSLYLGGRFIGATTMHGSGEQVMQTWGSLGCYEVAWPGSDRGVELEDGGKIELTIFGIDRKAKCVIPNHLWSAEAISEALLKAGFREVDWVEERFSGEEDKEWSKEARKGFGANGFFVALKGT